MKRLFHLLRPFSGERRIIAAVMAVWLVLVGSLLLINWRRAEDAVFDLAVVEARSSFNKDLVYRRWSAMHGGVYVPPTDKTPPNPYLAHIPDRDVVTTEGKRLTLVNPAYMTRQVHELGARQYGARGHITSLNPIRPENAADPWETQALKTFHAGKAEEIRSVEVMDGRPFLRFMKPMVTEKYCLKCHAAQGHREGDICGGISVSVPFTPYLDIAGVNKRRLLLAHGVIGLLGVFGIWFAGFLLVRSRERLQSERDRLQYVLEGTDAGTWEWNVQTGETIFNKRWADIIGYTLEEICPVSIDTWKKFVHPDDLKEWDRLLRLCFKGQSENYRFESRMRHKNGEWVWVLNCGKVTTWTADGSPEWMYGTHQDITARKRNEQSLLNEHALFAAGPVFIITLAPEPGWPVTFVSKNISQILGFTQEEMTAPDFRYADLIHPDDLERIASEVKHALTSGAERFEQHYRLRHKSGEYRWFSDFTLPIRDKDGKVTILHGYMFDDTERMRLEVQVRQRLIALTQPDIDIGDLTLTDIVDLDLLQRLQDAFADAFNMPSIIYGPKGTPITRPSCFRPFCKLVRSTERGAARCEAFDEKRMRALRENHTPQIRRGCALNNMVTGTVPIMIQDRHLANWGIGQMVDGGLDPDEVRRYAAEIGLDEEDLIEAAKTLDPVNNEAFERAVEFLNVLAGQISLLALQNVQQGRDIARREQAEATRERLMHAIENTKESIVITDIKGTIQYVNPAFEHITGYTREEAVGQNPRILKSGEHDEAFYKEMWGTLSSGKSWAGRITNKKKDGTLFTEDATISPVIDASGNTTNYVAVKRDVTQAIQFENEKARLAEQYRQAQKVESIGRLAGGVAHDLNNLLTPIIGYSEMLQYDIAPGNPRLDKVDQILRAGMRARDLVRQLLAFSRKQTLDFKLVEINKAIAGFEKFLRRTIREDIKLELFLSPDPLTVMADIGQIEQVLMNLAVNAADAMPDGGRLTIETTQVDLDEEYAAEHTAVEPGPYVLLSVSDSGIGMDDETRENIFEPFFSTKSESGTGLGLATVYGIVKQHGGNIWVYSEPGKGTTFKIYLPVCEAAPVEETTGKKEIADLTGTETILLAEDNEQVRELAHAILERQGFTVLVAENGQAALAILERHDGPLHLLLTDVVMPEVNGRDLFAKAAERHPGLKVLYMSGYTDNVIAHRGILDKNVAFIQKPFSVNALAAKVREVLDQ